MVDPEELLSMVRYGLMTREEVREYAFHVSREIGERAALALRARLMPDVPLMVVPRDE